MTYEEFKTNFLPEFLNIKSFAGKIKFAKEHLTQIGSGTGRVVYDIDGEKVLKLAKNPKGIAQNEAEANAGRYPDTHSIVTEVFEESDDSEWLISEKAKKVNEARIKQLTGIPSLNDLYYYLRNFHDQNNGKRAMFGQDREMVELLNENEFVQELQNFIANYSQSPGDFGRPSTYGEVLRDGQPSIVLTDYGLNDEVYDTHYSGKLKQRGYRMYEMYNFADGNDDILSDMPPQDGVDTRQGMWGLMPYGVGDGPGVINEEFISFVENRDKYPTGVLPSTPYMLDEFHDIVNNLREVLDHVQDKKKFYNNLLELQDYLIRGKFYDREPLGKEMLSESPLAISKIPDEQSDKIASELSAKLNLGTPQPLGPGGGNGKAYLINGNKILKITVDPCEVFAGAKTNAAHPKTLVFTHKIYKAIDTETDVEVYALINDYIADKPYDDFERYKTLISSLDTTNENALYEKLLDFLMKGKTKAPEFFGMTLDDFPELAKLILTNKPEANISQEDRQKAYQYMMGLYEIRRELLSLGIKSRDFMVSSNLGYKDGVLIYFDIGECQVPDLNIPPDAIIRLPEGKEMLDEDVSGFPKEVADKVANSVVQKFGYSQPKPIGYGVFGYAYDIGNNMVLKVTKDQSEANENLELIGKPLKYIAQPYKVYSIKSKTVNLSMDRDVYVIILEKLKTDPAEFKARVDRLKFAFKRIMDVNYGDVLDHYVRGPYPGDEVDEEKVQKYMSRNPQDAEFFNKILKIAEEARKYGVGSMDYVNPGNLGYKPDGTLAFFDVGFGNYFFRANTKPEEVQVDEDASALYSTENSFGQDNFPVHNNDDTSPMIQNDLNANSAIDEDLEYNHVVGDATQDEFQITERVKSSMPGSSTVEVKQKCRLAGNGNTSTACNQGDIGNLNIKPLNEYNGSDPKDFWAWVSPDNQLIKVPVLNHRGYIMRQYKDRDFGWDYERVFEKAMKDGWVRVTHEYDSDRFYGTLALNGYDKDRVKEVFKDKFFDLVKYGNYGVYVDYENPKGSDGFSTRDSNGKAKLVNYISEEIDPKDLHGDDNDDVALKTVINGKRDVCFIKMNPNNAKMIEKNHLGVFPVRMTSQNTMMALVYRDRLKALKLYKIAKEREGYLKDRTPEEAREIGQLLGYKEASIEEYIRRNQHRYGRQIPRAPEPEDFNDMDESIEGAGDKYYRAIEKYMGETIEFEPEGFYEAIDDNGNPIYKYDTFWVSETPEVAASKSVGGALMGLYSMFMQHSKNPGVFYVYEITEKPDVDISHWEIGDFTYLQEVRYRRPVRGSYVGKVDITDDFKKRMNAFYEINGLEAYDEPDEETSEIFQDTDYEQYLDKMKDTVHEQETLDVSEKNTIFEAENFSNDVLDKEYPIINGNEIEGLLIRSQIPNMGSIEASLTNYEILDGIRQVSFASFTQMENLSYYSPDEERKTKELAEQIKYNKEINPLIVVVDDEGPYVLEGGHRFDALRELNIPSFPAKVVIDLDSANIDENVINEAEIMSLQNLPFKQEVERLGGKIFSVGGAVRDEFLGKQSKDLDVLISGIPMNELEQLLSKYGRVDAVGKSFGVLKFKPKGATEEIDIAIPRTEKPTGDAGHKAFDVTSDHALPIEKDLERRDFTINAIAKDTDGNIVDPFNGQEDLKNKIIRIVNPQAFSDDPLRMLRAVQFASRFGFEIEPETMKMIQDNAGRVKEIAPERILTEFDKIIKKGDILTGVELLINTGLFAQIFGNDLKPSMIGRRDFANVRTMGEFIFLMTNGIMENPAAFYKTNLKGDIDTFKEIKALEMAFDSGEATSLIEARSVAHNMYVTSPQSLESQILPNVVKSAAQELLQGKYPKTVNELAVNGNDLTGIGLQGKAIGDMQKSLLLKVYANKVRNNREDLLNLTGQNNVKEGVGSKYAVKFGIPDTNADVKAMADVQTELETPYGYITGKDDKGNRFKIPVFKNPKSLTNFDKNARAIGDAEGNLYVAQENGWFNHGTMAFSLRLARTNMDIYDNDEDFVLLHRNGESNGFGLSDSTAEYAGRNYDNLENTKYILRALKEKNPQYDFYKIYFGSITELYMNAGVGTSKSLDELYQQQNIAYTAVVLDEKSRSRLLERFSSMIPDGWETIAHHMTINMGEIDPEYQKFLGLSVRLTVEDVAIDDKVMAVGVSGFDSRNAKAHITIAVNRQEGGKPMMSNNLTDWKKIQKPLLITGKITEVKYV